MTISHGERVGIIGRNGSGKSTLLRTLAGVYPIKCGTTRVLGRIGTLLDIGLGFESESTGRENIYYRGMAMGFSRKKLSKVEKEIIDFAGLGHFIDLPMRTYSAGMYVRLGFAISTQFAPDVLLIDEIFGAGDAAFSEKAVKRMMDIVKRAGIVVLVTHDLSLVERLCTRVIWLDQGCVRRDGPPSVVIPQFLNEVIGS
jgi:lipopolysaccharide transport system ATP-binding protein